MIIRGQTIQVRPLPIVKIIVGLIGLFFILCYPILYLISGGLTNPIDHSSVFDLSRYLALTSSALIPRLLVHPYIWLFLPLITSTSYLLVSRQQRLKIDLAFMIIALISIGSIIYIGEKDRTHLTREQSFESNLVVVVKNVSGKPVEDTSVCLMRYAFNSSHTWRCQSSDKNGKIYFSTSTGVYDVSLGNDEILKYPQAKSVRVSVTGDETKIIELNLP